MTAKFANLPKEEIAKAVAEGKNYVLFELATGKVISLHKSYNSAMRKNVKMGQNYNVGNFRAGYVY